MKPWQMGTHLIVLSENFHMNNNMAVFVFFLIFHGRFLGRENKKVF